MSCIQKVNYYCCNLTIRQILTSYKSPKLCIQKNTLLWYSSNLSRSKETKKKFVPNKEAELHESFENDHGAHISLRPTGKDLNIIKLSKDDSMLSKMLLKVKSKKTRTKSGLIMLEGKRLIRDAAASGVVPEMIFFSRKTDLDDIDLPYDKIKLYRTPYKEIQLWSDLTTSPGILAICKIPTVLPKPKESFPVSVICDQVREPGNLGTIIRNSVAAGTSKLILISGCTDPWDTKVLRAGTGGHFKVPIHHHDSWDFKKELTEATAVFLADNSATRNFDSTCQDVLPLVPYYSVDFNKYAHITLVIGGETEGLSDSAFQFAKEFNGVRLNIPMSNGVDSLNTGAALSVILFEIKRQKLSQR